MEHSNQFAEGKNRTELLLLLFLLRRQDNIVVWLRALISFINNIINTEQPYPSIHRLFLNAFMFVSVRDFFYEILYYPL